MATYHREIASFADTAPVRFEGEVVVDVAPEDLWAVLIDNESWPDWFGSPVKKVTTTSEQRTGIGSTRSVVLGAAAVEEEFIVWDEFERWSFTGISGPPIFRRLVERCTIHVEGPGRTRVTYRMACEPTLLLRPLLPILRREVPKTLTGALGRMAEVASARAAQR